MSPERSLTHAYCTWLLDTGRSVSTATQYASALESFLKNVDPRDPERVAEYFASRTVAWRGKVTLAYRAFVKFRVEEGEDDWPPLTRQVPDLPETTLLALAPLIDRVGVRTVARLTWEDADLDQGCIYSPGVKHQVVAQGDRVREWLQTFHEWGKPEEADAPLIPLRPGHTRSRPERILSKDRKSAEATLRALGAEIRASSVSESPSEAPEGPADPSLGGEVPQTPQERLNALREALGRDPTQQELAVYF
jgi:hypothetical protein